MKRNRKAPRLKGINLDDWIIILQDDVVAATEALENLEHWPLPFKYNQSYQEPTQWFEMPVGSLLELRMSFFQAGAWDEPFMALQWAAWDELAPSETAHLSSVLQKRFQEINTWRKDPSKAYGRRWGRVFQTLHLFENTKVTDEEIETRCRIIRKYLSTEQKKFVKPGTELSLLINPIEPLPQAMFDELGFQNQSINSPNYVDRIWADYRYEYKKQGTRITEETIKAENSKFHTAIDDWIEKRISARYSSAFLQWRRLSIRSGGKRKTKGDER